ncbi:MAG: FAD-dependent oxidoreductase [Actinomycetota bacterium]|nr:FAD-dependent oxidoreductase [Actinomycetota bacterium]
MAETARRSDGFDVIVVGAGPAGTAAAYTLAKAGIKVALIERGVYPGAKNVMGGVMYSQPVGAIIPNFWDEAPLERHIIEQQYQILSPDSAISGKHRSTQYAVQPHNRYTVLRAKFDAWFAGQADAAGAYLLTNTVVTDPIIDNGRVIGVSTDRPDGDLYANVVIVADGVNSLIAEKLGLRPVIDTVNMALAVKEIVALPRGKIEDRFNLEGDEGATIDIYGEVARGMVATGFIYTNKDSLSVGLGVILKDLVKSGLTPYELLDGMKNHPTIKPLLAGGEPREYLAHMIPEGGYQAMPKLYSDGVLIAGDAAMMVNGFHREGSNLAMTSGKLAAETAIEAIEHKEFGARAMSAYKTKLNNSYILQDLRKYRKLPGFISSRPQIFNVYPQIINDAATEFLTVDSVPKKQKQWKIWRQIVKKRRPLRKLLRDIYEGWRAFG